MKRPVIIFEGPDGSGKSVRAAELHARLRDSTLLHTGPPPTNMTAFEQYCSMLDALAAESDRCTIIFDRFHVGERCYGPALRGRDTLSRTGQFVVESQLVDDFQPLLVLCRPPFTTARDTWAARQREGHELVAKQDQYVNVWERYLLIEGQTILPTVVYDYTNADSVLHLEKCITRLLIGDV